MDNIFVLLSEDNKLGFYFRGLFMNRLPTDIQAHLLSESIIDPHGMALPADKL